MTIDVRYARNGDVNIAYAVRGNGPLDLVIIPGFVSHLEMAARLVGFQDMTDRIAGFSRNVTFDKRGTGLSDRSMGIPTVDELMGDTRAVMDAVGLERAAILGVSEGASAALLFAATYPERVTALALYGGYARVASAPDYPIGFPPEMIRATAEYLYEAWGSGEGLSAWAPSAGDDEAFRRGWAEFQRSAASPRDARAILSMYEHIDVRSALSSISAPTLVVHRDGDLMVPAAMGRYIAEHIDGAHYVGLPGADHFPWVGDMERVIGEIEEFLTGTRHAVEPTRKLATILFTDIVSSTTRTAELGDDAWRDLIVRHDRTVHQTLGSYGGRSVKSTGDGVLATFEGPTAAVRCAHAIRDEVADLGLQLRAGVHTGEVEIIGEDIGGIGVVIARRVADLAADGEVWVSATVPGLTVGSGIGYDDRGSHGLKGVPGDWSLYATAPS